MGLEVKRRPKCLKRWPFCAAPLIQRLHEPSTLKQRDHKKDGAKPYETENHSKDCPLPFSHIDKNAICPNRGGYEPKECNKPQKQQKQQRVHFAFSLVRFRVTAILRPNGRDKPPPSDARRRRARRATTSSGDSWPDILGGKMRSRKVYTQAPDTLIGGAVGGRLH